MRLDSSRLADGRRVTVYLPPKAKARPRQPYPLLVLHDGQNLFEPDRAFVTGQHWQVAETADRLIAARTIPPLVICGVDHAGDNRIHEMTPTPGPDGVGGGARQYEEIVIDEVLPLVRAEYPVRRDRAGTALGGSSLGGLITLSTLIDRPGVFSRAIVMSPSVWWDRRVILRQLTDKAERLAGVRMWIDVGLDEGAVTVADARRLGRLITRIARDETSIRVSYREVAGGDHSERSWAERLPRAMTFLYGRD